MMPDHLAKPGEPVQSGRKYAKVCCYSVMPVCSEQLKKNCGSVMNGLLKKMMICWYLYCG
jgi:hypothetical protein